MIMDDIVLSVILFVEKYYAHDDDGVNTRQLECKE